MIIVLYYRVYMFSEITNQYVRAHISTWMQYLLLFVIYENFNNAFRHDLLHIATISCSFIVLSRWMFAYSRDLNNVLFTQFAT